MFGYLDSSYFITINTVENDSRIPAALRPASAPVPPPPPPPGDATPSAARERVFRALELHDAATIGELAASTGLHENTVREHLSRLRSSGRVRSRPAPATGRGRPAQLWSVVDLTTASAYAGLAAALATALAQSPDARRLAYEAGFEWGERVAAERADDERGSLDLGASGPALVVEVMREQGFDPSITGAPADLPHEDTGRGAEGDTGYEGVDWGTSDRSTIDSARAGHDIELRRCPLRAAAAAHPEVVCAVHAGLVAGLAGSRCPALIADLTPFASPERCLLQIRPAS